MYFVVLQLDKYTHHAVPVQLSVHQTILIVHQLVSQAVASLHCIVTVDHSSHIVSTLVADTHVNLSVHSSVQSPVHTATWLSTGVHTLVTSPTVTFPVCPFTEVTASVASS
jgi:hypothetical protein